MVIEVGDVFELLVPCLKNPKGTRGVVFHVFDDNVFQVIFPNGEYDGFNTQDDIGFWIKRVGNVSLEYDFHHVMKVSSDFEIGRFDPYFKKAKEL